MLDMIDIYHGSVNRVEKPLFGEGKIHNDYGRGFYCTEHAELAKEWACSSGRDGYANHYQLDMTSLSVLNLSGQRPICWSISRLIIRNTTSLLATVPTTLISLTPVTS